MGLFKSIGKIAGAAIGFAVGGPKGAATGYKLGGKAGGAVDGKKSKGSSGGSSQSQTPDFMYEGGKSAFDILKNQQSLKTAKVGGQTLFDETKLLDDPWKHTKDWYQDLGGEGELDFSRY